MLKITSLMIGSQNAAALTKFYEEVFKTPMDEMMGWQFGDFSFMVMEHSEVKGKTNEGPRVIFNLEAQDVPAEFARIKALEGAEVVKEPYQMTMEGQVIEKGSETEDGFWIATLADPDGNYFQLMSPWEPK